MVQLGARWCKMVQDGAKWRKMAQDGARWRKMGQDGAIPCNSMQYHAKPCKTLPYHAIPWNIMQYHAIPCNAMQYLAIPCNTLITADGAYHCPVGSIMAIFSSVRSSRSHPGLLLIHPLFQITPVLNTGLSLSEPLQLYKGYNAI